MSTIAERAALQQQQLRALRPVRGKRRFTVWCGSSISPSHRSIADLASATYALVPDGEWDEVELLLKAGEGGTWQSAFDPHPLALSGPSSLASHRLAGKEVGLTITPYVVVRGKAGWVAGEQAMIKACTNIAGRCVLNVEPGPQYWDGPNDPDYIRTYLEGCGSPPETIEVCSIPRAQQVNELGGVACLQAWTDPQYVGSASFECYGISAGHPGPTSLLVNEAIPRLDDWGVTPGPQYRIPIVQRDERARWANTSWTTYGMQIWFVDGN